MHPDAPLFVYGTLRDPEIREGVLGRALDLNLVKPAAARGWRTVYYGDALYPALVQDTGTIAPGLLLSGLDGRDRDRLDAFEGDEYRREKVIVICGGMQMDALTYLPSRQIGTRALAWTFENWIRDHRPDVIAHYRADGFSGD